MSAINTSLGCAPEIDFNGKMNSVSFNDNNKIEFIGVTYFNDMYCFYSTTYETDSVFGIGNNSLGYIEFEVEQQKTTDIQPQV
jgi:hypothetical protein